MSLAAFPFFILLNKCSIPDVLDNSRKSCAAPPPALSRYERFLFGNSNVLTLLYSAELGSPVTIPILFL